MNDRLWDGADRAPVGSRYDAARAADAIAAVRELNWRQFVHLVAEAYRAHGYEATVTGDRSDNGIDLVLRKAGRTFLVQCKQWRSYSVDREAVRSLYGRVTAQQASGGLLLLTGSVQPDAQAFAAWAGIELVDGPAIHDLLYRGRLPGATRATGRAARSRSGARRQAASNAASRRSGEPAPTPSYAAQAEAFAAHLRPVAPKSRPWARALAGLGSVAVLVAAIGFAAGGMGLLPTAGPRIAAPADRASQLPSAGPVLELGGRPVGIAVDSDAQRGYVTDFDAGEVVMVDLATMTRVGKLHAPGRPLAIALDPDEQVVWVADFNGARVVAVDVDTGQQMAAVDVAKQPDYLAIDPARDRLYVSSRSTTELQVINTKSGKRLKPYRTTGSAALAMDGDNKRLYVSERETGRVEVYDFETKKWQTSTTCETVVTGMAVDGEQQRLYTIGDEDWVDEADLVARVQHRHQVNSPVRAIAIDRHRSLGYVLDPESGTLRSFSLK